MEYSGARFSHVETTRFHMEMSRPYMGMSPSRVDSSRRRIASSFRRFTSGLRRLAWSGKHVASRHSDTALCRTHVSWRRSHVSLHRGLLERNPEQSLRGVSASGWPIQPFTIFGDPCRCPIRNVIEKFGHLARRRYLHHRHSARYIKRAVRRNGKVIGTDTLREQHGTAFRLTIRIHLNAVEFVDTGHVYPAIVHLDPVLPREQIVFEPGFDFLCGRIEPQDGGPRGVGYQVRAVGCISNPVEELSVLAIDRGLQFAFAIENQNLTTDIGHIQLRRSSGLAAVRPQIRALKDTKHDLIFVCSDADECRERRCCIKVLNPSIRSDLIQNAIGKPCDVERTICTLRNIFSVRRRGQRCNRLHSVVRCPRVLRLRHETSREEIQTSSRYNCRSDDVRHCAPRYGTTDVLWI